MKFIYNISKYLPFMLVLLMTACLEEEETALIPQADFSIEDGAVLKQGETINFVNHSEESYSYLWSFGDGQTYVGVNASHVYNLPGDYTVTLKAEAEGSRSISSMDIKIEGLVPTASFSVEDGDNLKVSIPVSFVNETMDAVSYSWSFGDAANSTSTEESPTFTYDQPGDYTVTLTATGTGGNAVSEQVITVNPNNYELYFIDNDAGKMRKIDLNNPTVAVDVFDLPGFCMGMAYDATNEEFYYSDDDTKAVYKNTLTGSAQMTVASGLADPRDIALDIADSYMYVAERAGDKITRVDLIDNSTLTYYSSTDDANFLLPVGLDIYDGNLYATAVEIDSETVWKGSMSEISLTRIIDYGAGGYGYGLEVDKVNQKVYFDDTDGGKLLRADLDGSNIEEVGSSVDRVYGIAINNETGKVYWVDRNGLFKVANLDGTEEGLLVDLAVDVRGLIIRKVD
ncbi:PKD domain-containing protein [Reichenbachiella ulvae]|uniref:PKD domain-containing protein n=1 Tax=Reichenbachiella ulvae TaxID=2980104 RepID=A0ABT3CPA5_9BACT|nr:PKD domain-containing protein [Reichenbachiella ulvae]MCV9385299.1 PKD domain-containing protein [Reichenbachiella ulvae]